MNKEEQMLQKRLIELSELSYRRDIVTFSDFLNLNELNILHTTSRDMLSSRYETFGGYEPAERQMAAFLPDALYYEYRYPISVIRITPTNRKFAEDLTHRDFLGGILHLGIERSCLGDLLVDDSACHVFVTEAMADFICENLTRIRHTVVRAGKIDGASFSYTPKLETVRGTVASVRLDSVLSVAFPMSRSRLTGLIEGGKVFVNGKLITSNGYRLKEGDIISVRGMGKLAYQGVLSETKKGRQFVQVGKYI